MIILWKLFLQYLFNVYLEGTARVAAILPDLKIDLAVFCPRSVRFALNAMQKCNMPGLFSTHKSQTNLIITTWGAYVTRNRHKYLQGQLSFNRFLLLSIMKKFLHVLVYKKNTFNSHKSTN
jgi:hypothetical protein